MRLRSTSLIAVGLVVSLGLLPDSAYAQGVLIDRMPNTKLKAAPVGRVYTAVEQMPRYLDGGNAGLTAFCKNTFRVALPPGATRLLLAFVVDQEGKPSKPSLYTEPENISIPESTRQAVVRGFAQLGDFVPGKQDSRRVNVQLVVPIAGATH